MTFEERAATLSLDLDMWQQAQRTALERGDIDDAAKAATSINKLTASIKSLTRERCEDLLAQLEAAIVAQKAEADQAAALDAFEDEMRYVAKH